MTFYNRIEFPVYYNDFDEGSVAWLTELMKQGHIPPGEIDRRSILDVTADDVRGFRQCHFFAGIGGWAYALRLASVPVDLSLWTGSPPCQPFSSAGRQEGRNDERHLAPHFLALVGSARPGMLLGEQVASSEVFGKATKRARGNSCPPPQWAWLDDLLDRLEASRYTAGAVDFPSAGVGAPHIRQRTYFGAVAQEWLEHAARVGRVEWRAEPGERGVVGGCGVVGMADSDSARSLPGTQRGIHRGQEGSGSRHGEPERPGATGGMVNLFGAGLEGFSGHGDGSREPGWIDADPLGSVGAAGAACGLDNTHGRDASAEREQSRRQYGQQPQDGGTGNADQRPGPLHGFWGTADWLFCRDDKWRPVEPESQPLAHGLSGRVGLLRGYGNAINPQAAAIFIKAFLETVTAQIEAASTPEPVPDLGLDGLIV